MKKTKKGISIRYWTYDRYSSIIDLIEGLEVIEGTEYCILNYENMKKDCEDEKLSLEENKEKIIDLVKALEAAHDVEHMPYFLKNNIKWVVKK